jgi:hypothetical protein
VREFFFVLLRAARRRLTLDGDYVENILFVPNSFNDLKAKDVLQEVGAQGF